MPGDFARFRGFPSSRTNLERPAWAELVYAITGISRRASAGWSFREGQDRLGVFQVSVFSVDHYSDGIV
jgi:hypothetical protein